MDRKSNLIISGALSICVYVLIMLAIMFYLEPKNVQKVSPLVSETRIELEILSEAHDTNIHEEKMDKENVETVPKLETVSKPEQTPAILPDAKSLFSSIKSDLKSQPTVSKPIVNTSNVSNQFKSRIEKENNTKELELSKYISLSSILCAL
ncbi:MAG: hypothetical protein HY307_04320 [Arcobacter sp.]|nr:hypothetical protein [Arcobacter sp.]